MTRILAEDTNIRVKQPTLDFNRPVAVETITPILTGVVSGVEQVVKVLADRRDTGTEILAQQVSTYNDKINKLSDNGQLSNEAITQVNLQANSDLIRALAKGGAKMSEINAGLVGLKNVFMSNEHYKVTQEGDRILTMNKDGQTSYEVNNKQAVKENTRLELLASLDPNRRAALMQLPAAMQDAELTKYGDQLLRQQDLAFRVEKATNEAKLFDLSEAERKPLETRLFNEIVDTTIQAVLHERTVILESGLTAEQKEIQMQQLFSPATLMALNPESGRVNLIGHTTQEILDAVDPYRIDVNQIRALGTTKLDRMTNKTMALKTAMELEELQVISGIPPNAQAKIILGNHMKNATITYSSEVAMVGANTSEGKILSMLSSSDVVLRSIAPKLNSFIDPDRENALEERVDVVTKLRVSMQRLASENAVDVSSSPFIIEHVLSLMQMLPQTRGWATISPERRAAIQVDFNRMLNTVRSRSPEALDVFESRLDTYIQELNLPWSFSSKNDPKELPTN